MWGQVYFKKKNSFQFCDVSTLATIHGGGLARFGYRTEKKLKVFKNHAPF
jgi:hypothetical protein